MFTFGFSFPFPLYSSPKCKIVSVSLFVPSILAYSLHQQQSGTCPAFQSLFLNKRFLHAVDIPKKLKPFQHTFGELFVGLCEE